MLQLLTCPWRAASPACLPGLQVYDVTRPETFTRLQSWLNEIETFCPNHGKDVVKLLVGVWWSLPHRPWRARG